MFLFLENIKVELGDPFTFDDVFDPNYQPREFHSTWIGGKTAWWRHDDIMTLSGIMWRHYYYSY